VTYQAQPPYSAGEKDETLEREKELSKVTYPDSDRVRTTHLGLLSLFTPTWPV